MVETVLPVQHGLGRYEIHIGAGILSAGGEKLKPVLPSRRVCVVTDEIVAKIYLVSLMKGLEAAGFSACPPVILPVGEAVKDFKHLEALINKLSSYKLDRKTTLIALGGGVIGDLTGFAAAIYMRGIPFVQVPTTLLAQVDSAVGGKTGINLLAGKNMAGAFHQPVMVLTDTETLKTLPPRELKAGYAEILKYALLGDAVFFEWLEKNGAGVLSGNAVQQQEAIARSCQMKAAIVAADEKEQNDIRALLNLGHSFGHALEAMGCYDGRLLHGEAVGIGMILAFSLSARLGFCPEADLDRLRSHMGQLGLMEAPPFRGSAGEVLVHMRGDKKNSDGKMTLILARGIGQAFVAHDIDEKLLLAFLQEQWSN